MDFLSLDTDHWITIINLEKLTTKEICRLTRVCKTLYDIIHSETIIFYINKINARVKCLTNQSPNPICRCFDSNFPKLNNYKDVEKSEMIIHSWFPLKFLLDFYDNYKFMKKMKDTFNSKIFISVECFDNGNNYNDYKNSMNEDDNKDLLFSDVYMLDKQWMDKEYATIYDTSAEYETITYKNITILNLYSSEIDDSFTLYKFINVKYINLSHTNFSRLPYMENVEELDISHTKIKDIESIKNCTKLNKLYMTSTNIEDISMLSNLDVLDVLDISNCYNIKNIINVDY